MPNSILHKRSSTSGVVPHAALLSNGEIALNSADGTWFIKKTDGTVLDLRQPLIADGGAQPIAGINAAAQDWQTRVIAAGGTVSATTFTAVNTFCNAIDNAGIRDRFYRLNLFCGDNLAACLVPLYRGPSLTGTQYGNTTDTNINFDSGDYIETGLTAGGLKGNGSNKYLNTGFAVNTVATSSRHLAAYEITRGASQFDIAIGAEGPTQLSQQFSLGTGATGTDYGFRYSSGTQFRYESGYTQKGAMYIGSQTGTTGALYKNGIAATTIDNGSNDGTGGTTNNSALYVFALNRANTTADLLSGRLGAYSVGLGMTAAQARAYYNAMQTFQAALNRAVPVVTNADAQNWIDRVHAAGGAASQSTADAVNNFCNAIDAAGIRDKFYRLNLFCGDSLTAAFVPLYRGPTAAGTQFGNSSDVMNVADNFVAGDYAETGVGGGLRRSALANRKYLNTGFVLDSLPSVATGHMAIYRGLGSAANTPAIGVRLVDNTQLFEIGKRGDGSHYAAWGGTTATGFTALESNHEGSALVTTTRTSATNLELWNNTTLVNTQTTSVTPVTTGARPVFVFTSNRYESNATSVFEYWEGSIPLQAYSIGLTLTSAQISSYYSAMRAFQNALSRTPPVVTNLDAQDWLTRVYAAGGTVSQTTANAVNTFCNTITSTGLRDRFYRLNLFCGNNLTACLVPLYRGQSLSGTQYGNTTDTNFNFVTSDYVETGLTGGLTGNGNLGVQAGSTQKYLSTGLQQLTIGTSLLHLSAYVFGLNTTATQQQGFVGIRDNSGNPQRWWVEYRGSVNTELGSGVGFGMNAPATGDFFIIASRESNALLRAYYNGSQFSADNTTDISATVQNRSRDWYVAAINVDGNPAEFCGFRLGMYSIGLTLTATQAAVFNTAVQTFQTALRRIT